MPATRTLDQVCRELRRLARDARRRAPRTAEVRSLLARMLEHVATVEMEERGGAFVFRLAMRDGSAGCALSCVLHEPENLLPLAAGERVVASRLCEGLTLAQIARLRGVSINTVKSQVRHIFRKLDVSSRVALVRRLCP